MASEKPLDIQPSILNNDSIILWVIFFLSWVLTIMAAATGQDHILHHDTLSLPLKLLIFLAALASDDSSNDVTQYATDGAFIWQS
ncbi:MAG: hypothetical protein U7123_24105 [Potamolinea sp.]